MSCITALWALYLIAGVIHKFHYLKLGLSLVLVFVGAKMLLIDVYKLPIGLSLGIVALVLLLAVIASLVFPKSAEAHSPVEHDPLAPTSDEVLAPIEAEKNVTRDSGAREQGEVNEGKLMHERARREG